jgi:hypothetical protein
MAVSDRTGSSDVSGQALSRAAESHVLRTATRKDASVHFAGYGDAGLAEDVGDLRVAEARSVVFEREVILLFIYPEASQAVSVSEGAEAAELFVAQRRLQFVGDFEQGHGSNYSSTSAGLWIGRVAHCLRSDQSESRLDVYRG